MPIIWTKVSKPSESSVTSSTIVGGDSIQPFGLLLSLTSIMQTGVPSITGSSIITGWGKVTKPSVYGWTNVSKPTT